MKITKITVRAGRTFNHPHEDYSNLQPSIVLEADLAEGEDANAAAKELQSKAEGLVEDHKQNMLRSLEELHDLTQRQAELQGLERSLRQAQSRIEEIRAKHPELKQLGDGQKTEAEATTF